MHLFCPKCNETAPLSTRAFQCQCGGLWRLNFTPPKFSLDLIDKKCWNLFRYRAFLPIEGDKWQESTLGEGLTPIIPFDQNLAVKMDYLMPTLSFKDRGAAIVMAHCKAIGIDSVVQDSSGNAGNSIAAYAARAGVECQIFVPEGTSPSKIEMIESHGADVVVVPGSRDNCATICREKVKEKGSYYASHVYNPLFYQGTKTYIYEVYEQLGRMPKSLLVPLGNGTLFLGIMVALEELLNSGVIDKMPQIYAVQGEFYNPIEEAWRAGAKEPLKVEPQLTLAEGIAIGEPMRGEEILEYIYRHSVKVIIAPESRILEAQSLLAQKGLYVEQTTAATYAAYLDYCEKVAQIEDCLMPLCGAGLKSQKN